MRSWFVRLRWALGLLALLGLIAVGRPGAQSLPPFLMYGVYNGSPRAVAVDTSGNVGISATISGADGAIQDGVTPSIEATVLDLTNSNPLTVAITDANGTQVTSFGGGTQYTQDAALTVATTVGTMSMGRASAAAPTDVSADNDAVLPWYLRSGAQVAQLSYAGTLAAAGSGATSAGTTRTVTATDSADVVALQIIDNIVFAEDAAHTTADNGVPVWAVRRDTTPSSSSGTAGDYSAINVDANGRVYVQAVLYNSSGTELVSGDVTEDAAETAGGTGPMVLSVRRDSAASSSGASGDNSTFNTDANGLLWSRDFDPCTALAKTTVAVSATADTVLISASASNRNYICGGVLVAGAAEIVSIWDGTGTVCGTGSAALVGSTTEANGVSLAANGGFIIPDTIRNSATNVDSCLRISGTNRVSGYITYVQAP